MSIFDSKNQFKLIFLENVTKVDRALFTTNTRNS